MSSKEFEKQWLRDLPDEWAETRADFLCNPYRKTVDPATLDAELVAHYSIPQVQDTGGPVVESPGDIGSTKILINEETLLVSKLNPRKKTICIGAPHPELPTLASSEFVPINSQKINLRYAFYVWQSEKVTDRLSALVQSATRSHQRVNPSDITKLEWRWPPLDTQRRIAAFLDEKTARIDALIDKKRQLLDRLAEKRQALITRAVTKGLNPDAPMKPSGIEWLGDIPAHWEVVPLRRVLDAIEQGWSPEAEDRQAIDGEWAVLKSGCVNGGVFDPTEHKTLPPHLEPRAGLEVNSGDILMCRASGSKKYIGSVALIENPPPRLIFSDKTYRLLLSRDKVSSAFFVYSMAALHLREQIELSVSGAEGLANNIPQSSVACYLHAFPPLEEQRLIVSHLRQRLGQIGEATSSIDRSIKHLVEYRSALITAAVTGQITGLNTPKTEISFPSTPDMPLKAPQQAYGAEAGHVMEKL